MVQPLAPAHTYRELRALPDDGRRHELYEGEIVAMTNPTRMHQSVVGEVFGQLREQLRGSPCRPYVAPLDVRFARPGERAGEERTVLQPDVMVVCRREREDARGIRGAPDFVLEVLGTSTAGRDQGRKRRLYEEFGVREYWLFDPLSRVLTRYFRAEDVAGFGPPEIGEGEQRIELQALPGIAVDFEQVERPDPELLD